MSWNKVAEVSGSWWVQVDFTKCPTQPTILFGTTLQMKFVRAQDCCKVINGQRHNKVPIALNELWAATNYAEGEE